MAVATRDLRISDELALPLEAVTRSFGLLGMRGAGKSNAAVVLAEEMFRAGLQWVVIDPAAAWWGIRSSADGEKNGGLPVVIFGGEHADVPLEPTAAAGVLVADLILDQGISAVLDLSQMTKGQKIAFLAGPGPTEGFAGRLFRRKSQDTDPIHVFLEEAHDYLPQMVRGDVAKLVEAVSNFQTIGRGRGFGCSVLSQRSSRIHKDVLLQIDTLIAFRTIGPHDRRAIEEWVRDHDVDRALVASLPELRDGESWLWSPEWLGRLERVHWRRRSTYDSGATPKVGQARRKPATLADVDVEAVTAAMAATIERHKADDPKELRRRIRELEQQLAKRPTETKVETVEKVVEVPVRVIDPHVAAELRVDISKLESIADAVAAVAQQLQASLGQATAAQPATPVKGRVAEAPRGVSGPARRSPEPRGQSVPVEPTATPPLVAARPASDPAGAGVPVELTGYARRLLETLAGRDPMTPTRGQLAVLSGSSPRSSAYDASLALLRRGGYVETVDGMFRLTPAGWDAAGTFPRAPSSPDELLDHWLSALPPAARHLLDVLVAAYPMELSRAELSTRSERSATSSSFDAAIALLRKMGLLVGSRDGMRVSAELMGG